MHDIKAIRENPKEYDDNWSRRGVEPQTSEILNLDEKKREVQTELQSLLQQRNEKSKEIGQIKSKGCTWAPTLKPLYSSTRSERPQTYKNGIG